MTCPEHHHLSLAVTELDTRMDDLEARTLANRERIVELVGVDGKNGRVGDLRKDMAEVKKKVDTLALRTAGGALAGGGAVAGLIEAVRALLGG